MIIKFTTIGAVSVYQGKQCINLVLYSGHELVVELIPFNGAVIWVDSDRQVRFSYLPNPKWDF